MIPPPTKPALAGLLMLLILGVSGAARAASVAGECGAEMEQGESQELRVVTLDMTGMT